MNGFARRVAVFGLGSLLLGSIGGIGSRADAVEIRRSAERVIPFGSSGEIRLEGRNGRITVEAWSRPEVRLQITRNVRAESKSRAEELMKRLQSDVEIRGHRIRIVSRFPKLAERIGLWDLLGQRVASAQIHYSLQVPAETDLVLETTNGEVRVHGTNGRLDATTTNGGIRAGEIRGRLTLSTTNGEIQLSGISGTATAHTTNGSVTAELREVSPQGEVRLQTTNGNVEVFLEKDVKAALEAVTTNGRVRVEFPITTEGVVTSKAVRGTINGGGAVISLSTTNGNVNVRRLGDRRP